MLDILDLELAVRVAEIDLLALAALRCKNGNLVSRKLALGMVF